MPTQIGILYCSLLTFLLDDKDDDVFCYRLCFLLILMVLVIMSLLACYYGLRYFFVVFDFRLPFTA